MAVESHDNGSDRRPPRATASAPARSTSSLPAEMFHNREAEASILGGIILRNELLAEVALDVDDFFHGPHRTVFQAMHRLVARTTPIDVVTIAEEIERVDRELETTRFESIGGHAFLGLLALNVPTEDNVLFYAKIVRQHAVNRGAALALGAASHRLRNWQHDPAEAITEIIGDLQRHLEKVPRTGSSSRLTLMRELATPIVAQSSVPRIDWGLSRLNPIAPLPVRSMATLYGPTGGGKTALALELSAKRSRYADRPVDGQGPTLYVQLELTPAQLAARRCSQVTPYTWSQVIGGALRHDEIETALTGEHIYVVKMSRRANLVDEARRALDELARIDPGTPLLVIDYLQRVRLDGKDPRWALSNTVDEIVDLTESRDMYTLLLSKGSRGGSRLMRDGKTRGETLVDAGAETGAIEAGSSVILAITYEDREGEDTTDARLVVAKARYGQTGASLGARFFGASGRWIELDEVPLPKSEREAADRVIEAVRNAPNGFESRSAIYKAIGGKKQSVLAAVANELKPGGRLFASDGRILAHSVPK